MTLAELLTATIIVGIMMLGIVSIELAMRRTFSTTSKSASLSMRVSGAMVHLSRNISRAIGDAGSRGIIKDTSISPCTKLYVRQDNDVSPSPADYSNDTWVRYKHNASSTNAPLMFCDAIAVAGDQDPVVNDTECAGNTCAGNSYELLRVQSLDYTVIVDNIDLQFYTEVNLNAYYDNSQPYDPIKNPKIENMQTKINYMSHSW